MFCARLFICASWSPAGKGLTSWLSFVVSSVSGHFPIGILGQVWYLIVSIPDLCNLTYFACYKYFLIDVACCRTSSTRSVIFTFIINQQAFLYHFNTRAFTLHHNVVTYDMVYFKFQKGMEPMRINNLTLSDGIKTVQNIALYVMSYTGSSACLFSR